MAVILATQFLWPPQFGVGQRYIELACVQYSRRGQVGHRRCVRRVVLEHDAPRPVRRSDPRNARDARDAGRASPVRAKPGT